MKNSVNARLEYARLKNESPAIALLERQSKKKQEQAPAENVQTTNVDVTAAAAAAVAVAENFDIVDNQIDIFVNCVCSREPATLRCTNCGLLSYGRVVENCRLHRNVTFLMDFVYCPHCMASRENLQSIELNARVCQTLNEQMLSALRNFGTKSKVCAEGTEDEDEL